MQGKTAKIEINSRRKNAMKRPKYPNIYFALFVSLAAIAVGTAVSIKSVKSNSAADVDSTFRRVSVEWSDTAEIPETDIVNAPVTGIPDERETESSTAEQEQFLLPMGKDIIKDFSNGDMVRNETMDDWRVHNGIDFGGSEGNTVVAAADGIVLSCKKDEFWGGVTEIDHGNGLVIRYCGLNYDSCVKEGSQVCRGDKIGTLGNIPVEAKDGGHIHLEAEINGRIVDPLEAMNIAYSEE